MSYHCYYRIGMAFVRAWGHKTGIVIRSIFRVQFGSFCNNGIPFSEFGLVASATVESEASFIMHIAQKLHSITWF